MTAPRVERMPRRRGSFGLDERRFPDPARVEAELRSFLAGLLPEVWPLPAPSDPSGPPPRAAGRTLALLLARGHVAVLRIDRDPGRPDPETVALAERCRAMRIPHATVSSLAEGRAALRRLGVEPRPEPPPSRPTPDAVFGRR